MIKVTFKHDTNRNTISFKVTGHSGASAIGTDLICAGASTLAYTLAQNVYIFGDSVDSDLAPGIKLGMNAFYIDNSCNIKPLITKLLNENI